jgi:hypothetical protein
MAEDGDAFVDLRQRGFQCLAHFQRRHAGEAVAMLLIGIGQVGQQRGPLRKVCFPPCREACHRPVERSVDLRFGQRLMDGDFLTGGGIDAFHDWLRIG